MSGPISLIMSDIRANRDREMVYHSPKRVKFGTDEGMLSLGIKSQDMPYSGFVQFLQ